MTYVKRAKSGGVEITSAALTLSGLEEQEFLEVQTLNGAVVLFSADTERHELAGIVNELVRLAEAITPKYMSNIECGDKIPKFETFISIANALQIDANTLLADELVAMPQVQSSILWDKISKLPPSRQKHIIRMIDMLLEDEN